MTKEQYRAYRTGRHQRWFPATPGDRVYRIEYASLIGKFRIKECRVTKIILTEDETLIVSTPVHSFVNIKYTESIDEFIDATELTLKEAEQRVGILEQQIDELEPSI